MLQPVDRVSYRHRGATNMSTGSNKRPLNTPDKEFCSTPVKSLKTPESKSARNKQNLTPSSTMRTIFSMDTPEFSGKFEKANENPQRTFSQQLYGPVNHRTSLGKLKKISGMLSPVQKKTLEALGVGAFTKMNMEKIDRQAVGWLICNFNPVTRELHLHNRVCVLTKKTAQSTLGLPCTDIKVPLDNGGNKSYLTYLDDCKGHQDLTILEGKLNDVIRKGSTDDQFKILYLAFLFSTVLFPGSHPRVNKKSLQYIQNLDEFMNYDWAGQVLQEMVDGIKNMKDNNKEKPDGEKSNNVTGCIFLLQLVFMNVLLEIYNNKKYNFIRVYSMVEQWTQREADEIIQEFKDSGGFDGVLDWSVSGSVADTWFDNDGEEVPKLTSDKRVLARKLYARIEEQDKRINQLFDHIDVQNKRIYELETRLAKVDSLLVCPDSESEGEDRVGKSTPNENRSTNLRNSNTQSHGGSTDIFMAICKAMSLPKPEILDHLFDPSLEISENFVIYENYFVNRDMFLTLRPEKYLDNGVLNSIAYITWCERRSSSTDSRHWNLPTHFCSLAQDADLHPAVLDYKVFGKSGLYIGGTPDDCLSVSIPVFDDVIKHWLLCRIDFENMKVEICDTLRDDSATARRETLIRNAVEKLDQISRVWKHGKFKCVGWSDSFEYVYSTTLKRQPNFYDCGVYVCLLMMFREGVNRALLEEESISTRRRIAYKILTSAENKRKTG